MPSRLGSLPIDPALSLLGGSTPTCMSDQERLRQDLQSLTQALRDLTLATRELTDHRAGGGAAKGIPLPQDAAVGNW